MSLGQSGLFRQFPVDRNNLERSNRVALLMVAPHGQTSRFAQTVPSGRRMHVTNVEAKGLRTVVSGNPGEVLVLVVHTPIDAGQITILLGVDFIDGAVGAGDLRTQALEEVFKAGAIIQAFTSDASVGGFVDYEVGFSGFEYDT